MPEPYDVSATITIKKKPAKVFTVSSGIGDSDGFPLFDNEDPEPYNAVDDLKWGFRITGGAEFRMPITVFQVTEGSLGYNEGIKLGDIVLELNGVDTTNLTLAQAQQIIDTSNRKLYLITRNIDDEELNDGVPNPKTIVLRIPLQEKPLEPRRAHIEKKLRDMQRKLSDIAQIPNLIQLTLESVTKTFREFLPIDEQSNFEDKTELEIEEQKTINSEEDDLSLDSFDSEKYIEIDEKQNDFENFTSIEDENCCPSEKSDFVDDEYMDNTEENNNEYDESISTPSTILTPEPTEEDLQKIEKQNKILQLEKSWPWADRQKIVYKQSNCYLVPRSSHVLNRIKKLTEENFGIFNEVNVEKMQ